MRLSRYYASQAGAAIGINIQIHIHMHTFTFTDIHHTFTYIHIHAIKNTHDDMHAYTDTDIQARRQTDSQPAGRPASQADRQTETYRYAGIQT